MSEDKRLLIKGEVRHFHHIEETCEFNHNRNHKIFQSSELELIIPTLENVQEKHNFDTM